MSDKGSNIKSRLPSRHVSVGPKSAPHRSMYYAMGMTEEQIYQPFVGVATTWNESAPCNITLGRQAQAVKKGVKQVNGTPREFTTITVTDGIAMGHEAMKASLAIAGKCKAALVEPPVAATTTAAFFKDSSVTMSRGLIFFSIKSITALPLSNP